MDEPQKVVERVSVNERDDGKIVIRKQIGNQAWALNLSVDEAEQVLSDLDACLEARILTRD